LFKRKELRDVGLPQEESMEKILEVLQEEFKASLSKTTDSIRRNYQFPEAKNIAKVAAGIMRSGKTYFLFQTMRDLIS
jgi:hypothetical protein